MSIKYVILGFLSESPLTGYDLKKKFSTSEIFHWSGNNNQIYRSLVDLHTEGLVTVEVEYQDSKPPRKIYTITEAGRVVLREWLGATPELPQIQNPLLVQLTWADQLEPAKLDALLSAYADDLHVHVLMLRQQAQADTDVSLKRRIAEHWMAFYERELDWVLALRRDLER